jgi:tetratricopeptide (TPR) repeat protein
MPTTTERLISTARALLAAGDATASLKATAGLFDRELETVESGLLRAEAHAAMGQKKEMCAALDHLHALDPNGIDSHRAALELSRRNDQLMQALSHSARIVRALPDDPTAWSRHFEVQHGLHRFLEALDSLLRAVSLAPERADLAARAARVCTASRDYAHAREIVAAARTHCPDDPVLVEMWAELAARLQWPGCEDAIEDAHVRDPTRWWQTVARWLTVGRIDRAEALMAEEAAARGDTPLYLATSGRLALWRGDIDTARSLANRALSRDAQMPEAHLVLGGAATLAGDAAEGLPALEAALHHIDRAAWFTADTALTFRAQLREEAAEIEAAVAAASAAMSHAVDYNVAAHITRMLAASQRLPAGVRTVDRRFMEIAAQVHDLADDPANDWNGSVRGLQAGFRASLRRMGGNRSATTTVIAESGRLVRYAMPPYPRNLARHLQLQIRCRPAADVLAGFAQLAQDHPDDPTVHTYWGELLVWLGDADRAAHHFQTAIALDRRTTWAWIGLGAAQMLRDELNAALDTWAEGILAVDFEGPTVFVYRGEVCRRLGQLDAARADLIRATQDKPQRLSAWINRTLVDAACGDTVPAQRLAERIRTTNPSLWTDAAHIADSSDPVDLLGCMLDTMAGNRSSTVLTYLAPTGQLRFARWSTADVPANLNP